MSPTERLRVSPNFALRFGFDGRPYVAKEAEPYVEYWLSERYRVLHSLFAARRGLAPDEAITAYLRSVTHFDEAAERRRLTRAIDDMREAGVLVGAKDEASRYDARMADAYLAYRPFPSVLVDHLVDIAGIGRLSRVLDLAGGPGDLATQLAATSRKVSMMELSGGFVAAARRLARQRGVPLATIQESCNRLPQRDDTFDVVTVSQALHWLDDVAICRGACRVLGAGGSFFVIHSAISMDDAHPLAHLFGDRSVLGAKRHARFIDEVRPLWRRAAGLVDALDAPDIARVDNTQRHGVERLMPAGVALFRQTLTIGSGFARAFLSDRHVDAIGMPASAVLADVDARCADVDASALDASLDWAVLHFRRQPDAIDLAILDAAPIRPIPRTARAG